MQFYIINLNSNLILWMKIFMYFENIDMCFNTQKEKKSIILNAKFDHLGLNPLKLNIQLKLKKIETGITVGQNFIFIKKITIFFMHWVKYGQIFSDHFLYLLNLKSKKILRILSMQKLS